MFHSVGIRVFNQGNSSRNTREVRPLMALTSLCTPYCGSTSTRRCTWSGMVSSSTSHAPFSSTTSRMSCFRRASMRPPITRRRYFGHHTTWNAHWNAILALVRSVTAIVTVYSTDVSNLTAELTCSPPRLKPGVRRTTNYSIERRGRHLGRHRGGDVHQRVDDRAARGLPAAVGQLARFVPVDADHGHQCH